MVETWTNTFQMVYIIKGIKINRNNLYSIGTLPAEVGSSSDAMIEEKRWGGNKEREWDEREGVRWEGERDGAEREKEKLRLNINIFHISK